jgi:anti-sigma-K factor RskA
MSEHDKFADELPLLVIGALEGPEREAVEAHARGCDVCSRELQRLNGDVALLALATPVQAPPERAKARLMNALRHEPNRMPMRANRGRWWRLVPSAVALGLLVLAGALWYQNRALRHELQAVERHLTEGRADTWRAAQVVRLLTQRDAMRVTLVATNAKPQPTGRAIYSPRSGLVFFASNFEPVPQDKAYELWLIPQHGAPIPAGMFKPDANGSATVLLPSIPKDVQAKAFAITIERAEGATTPTMPIVMVGQG